MTPESVQNLLALALGFGVAGLCRSAYQLVTGRLPSFGLLSAGPSPSSFAVVPVSMLAAPAGRPLLRICFWPRSSPASGA
jgi:uncharacterized protein DUF6949